jgi:hypothetical protein
MAKRLTIYRPYGVEGNKKSRTILTVLDEQQLALAR